MERAASVGEIADRAIVRLLSAWPLVLCIAIVAALPLGFPLAPGHQRTQLIVRLCVGGLIVNSWAIPAMVAVAAGNATTLRAVVGSALSGFWKTLRCTLAALLFIVPPIFLVSSILAVYSVKLETMLNFRLIVSGVVVLVMLAAAPLVTIVALAYPISLIERTGAFDAWGIAWSRAVRAAPRGAWLTGVTIVLLGTLPGIGFARVLDALADDFDFLLPLERPISALVHSFCSIALSTAFATVLAMQLHAHAHGADLEAAIDDR